MNRCSLTVRIIFIGLVVITAVYWSLALVLPSEPMNDLLDGSLVAVAAVVVFKYSSWTLLNLRSLADQRFMIRFGIVLVWSSTVLWRMQRIIYQTKIWSDVPIGIHDYSRGYFILVAVAGAALHVTGIGIEKGQPVRENVLLPIVAAIGGALAVLMLQFYLGIFGPWHLLQ